MTITMQEEQIIMYEIHKRQKEWSDMLIKTLNKGTALPAGDYYISDPSYFFFQDNQPGWIALLNKTNYFGSYDDERNCLPRYLQHGVFSLENKLFAVSSTAFGDGCYHVYDRLDEKIGICGVDAGCIAAIPKNMVELDEVKLPHHGHYSEHTFDSDFTINFIDDEITFTKPGSVKVLLTIPTGNPYRLKST